MLVAEEVGSVNAGARITKRHGITNANGKTSATPAPTAVVRSCYARVLVNFGDPFLRPITNIILDP